MELEGKQLCIHCLRIYDTAGACPHCGFEESKYTPKKHQLPLDSILNRRYLMGMALGETDFSITYSAWDKTLNRPIVIREYHPAVFVTRDVEMTSSITPPQEENAAFLFESGRKRFLREARMLAMFNTSPGIVSVLDCFEENGTAYIAMEFIRGESLRHYVNDHHLTADLLLEMVRPLTETLMKVHQMGLLHRTISPENILVDEKGYAKLIGFGASDAVPDYKATELTSVILNRTYAPEEQYNPQSHQGPWTDVYALSATLYRLLTGIIPPPALERLHTDKLQPPHALGVKLSRRQERALLHGLAPQIKNRTDSMERFRSELYNLPLPVATARHSRRFRIKASLFAAMLGLAALTIVNQTTGLPLGSGLLLHWSWSGALVSQYSGKAENLSLPEHALGVPVVAIGQNAFTRSEALCIVTIKEGVKLIGDMSFYKCENLKEVYLPETLISIGAYAFAECKSLGSIRIPESVTDITDNAFMGCSETLLIYGVRGSAAEKYCAEQGIRFCDTQEFESISVEGGVSITAYTGTATEVCFPQVLNGQPVIALGGAAYDEEVHIGKPIAGLYSNVERIIIPEGVSRIYGAAFDRCMDLQEILLPDSLETIGKCAFSSCSLTSIKLPNAVQTIEKGTFLECDELEHIELPDRLLSIGESAFRACLKLKEIDLPAQVETIDAYAFAQCHQLERVSFAPSLRSIHKQAFLSCYSLSYIALPEGLMQIGSEAFAGCSSLTDVYLPSVHCTIDNNAFNYCGLDMVIISYAETPAAAYAAENGHPVINIADWSGDVEYAINSDGKSVILTGYTGNESNLILPDYIDGLPVTGIATESFANNRWADDDGKIYPNHYTETVRLPRQLTFIGHAAFYSVSTLNTVIFPASLKLIGDSAFSQCALSSLELPENLEIIRDSAFCDNDLTSVRLPNGIIAVGKCAFSDNALTRIEIPASVRRLGSYYGDGGMDEVLSWSEDCTIVGKKGSIAQDYAASWKFRFEPLEAATP